MEAHKARMRTSSEDPNWRTPQPMAQALLRTYPFVVDLAATRENAVVPAYLGPDHNDVTRRDALTVSWAELGRQTGAVGFLNPPYSLSKIRELQAEVAALVADEALTNAVERSYALQIAALRIENWAQKAYEESLQGFTTIGVFPYAPQTKWFRQFVMGHEWQEGQRGGIDSPTTHWVGWSGHAALDYWRLPHRVKFERADGSPASGANVNSCIVTWGPNPGFVGPWVPSGRYWSYR